MREEGLVVSNEGKIVLTNQRIEMKDRDWGRSYSIVIFLEDISSFEVRYKSNIIFATLAVIGIIMSIYFSFTGNYENNLLGITLIASLVFFVLWWISKQHIISI